LKHNASPREQASPERTPDEAAEPRESDWTDSPDWIDVRDSWVGFESGGAAVVPPVQIIGEALPPPSAPISTPGIKKSIPPPLPPASVHPASSAGLADGSNRSPQQKDPKSVRESLVDAALAGLEASDYDAALLAAEAILADVPDHVDALQCAEIARRELERLYDTRLGSRTRIPAIAVPPGSVRTFQLDASAEAVLALIDGVATIERIVAMSNLPEVEALKGLSELYLKGIVKLSSG
jgi:hypothetical protein